jgi:small subunit ribosomal protein S1
MVIKNDLSNEKKTVEEVPMENDTTQDEDFEVQLEASLAQISNYNIGDKVDGEIINITDSYIFVSLGGKRDAYADKTDYLDKKGNFTLATGDRLTGYIVKYTDTETVIARSIASANRKILRDAFNENVPIVGVVTSPVKGGFSINISGLRAFCPLTQMDTKIVSNQKIYAGKSFDFIITELSDDNKNIIVSRKKLLEQELEKQKQDILGSIEVGAVIKGKINRLTNFGAFIDLGGLDGLLHISEMAWERVESPSDVVNIGEEIEVKVIKISGDNVSLSLKALQPDPFEKAASGLSVGDSVSCKVLRNLKFGSFVEIKKGVEGLIPISEMALGKHIKHPREVVQPGDIIEAQIMKIDETNKKISLSLKALQPDPWQNIEQYFAEGDILEGTIENVTKFGIFVKLQDGITGLLPKAKMKFLTDEIQNAQSGVKLNVRITQIEHTQKRISLEPTNMPEAVEDTKDDWKKYRKQQKEKKKEYDPDNPFLELEL